MRATIYIRKENEEAWNSIENKSDFVNKLLSPVTTYPTDFKKMGVPREKVVDTPERLELCKNGHIARNGKCLQRDCK